MVKHSAACLHFVLSVHHASGLNSLITSLEAGPEGLPPVLVHCPASLLPQPWSPSAGGSRSGKPENHNDQGLHQRLLALVNQGQVRILAAGFSPALHSLLSPDEIRQDLQWALANPWRQGIADLGDKGSTPLMPFWADPLRPCPPQHLPDNPVLHSRVDLPRWGCLLLGHDRDGSEILLPCIELDRPFRPSQVADKLPLLNPLSRLTRALGRRLRDFEHQGCPTLPLALLGVWDDQGGILELLAALAKWWQARGGKTSIEVRLQTLPPALAAVLPPPGCRFSVSRARGDLDPVFRQNLAKLAELRQTRSTVAERIRHRLFLACPRHITLADGRVLDCPQSANREEDFPQTPPPEGKRGLISAMQGNAALMADDFNLNFSEGLPLSFQRESSFLAFHHELSAAALVASRRLDWQADQAVSFETDRIRGLRSSFSLGIPGGRLPGRLTVDHVLSDRSVSLIADCKLRFPWLDDGVVLDSLSPVDLRLDIPLGEGGPKLQVSWIAPGESLCSSPLPVGGNSRWQKLFCPGSAWTLRWDLPDGSRRGLVMQRMPSEARSPAPLELTWRKKGKTLELHIKPEGCYHNLESAQLRGLYLHFSLALYPVFGEDPPQLDPLAERDFEPFYLYRETTPTPTPPVPKANVLV